MNPLKNLFHSRDKHRNTLKIMTLDRAIRCEGSSGGSIYDERDLLVF